MKFTILCALLLSFPVHAKAKKDVSGCEEMNQPHMRVEFKMCVDAQKKMEAAIKMARSKGCDGMNTPDYKDEYKTCMKTKRLPANSK